MYLQFLFYFADLPGLYGAADHDMVCADSGTDHLQDYFKGGISLETVRELF